jgi:hypothetical protein
MVKIEGFENVRRVVQIEVESKELMKVCETGLKNEHLSLLIKRKVFSMIISASEELRDKMVVVFTSSNGIRSWLVEDGYDHHKGETLYTKLRDLTEEECRLLDLAEEVASLFNKD